MPIPSAVVKCLEVGLALLGVPLLGNAVAGRQFHPFELPLDVVHDVGEGGTGFVAIDVDAVLHVLPGKEGRHIALGHGPQRGQRDRAGRRADLDGPQFVDPVPVLLGQADPYREAVLVGHAEG